MAAELDMYLAAAWRAVSVWRARNVRPVFDMQIKELEDYVVTFAHAWLPIAWPPCDAQERDDLGLLLDGWGWPLKFKHKPIIRVHGSKFDEVVDAMRGFLCMPDASRYEVVSAFARKLLQIKMYRGRGYRYGLLSRGVSCRIADQVAGTNLTFDIVQGDADVCAESLLRTCEKELAAATEGSDISFLQLVHSEWVRDLVPDDQFRLLLTTSPTGPGLEALDILMGWPGGPIGWFRPFGQPLMPTWHHLSAVALGIVCYDSPESVEPNWWQLVSPPATLSWAWDEWAA